MTEIEKKALALENDIRVNQGHPPKDLFIRTFNPTTQALCRAIEQHEALQADKAKMRGLVATLWCASGCSCCRDDKTWEKVSAELAEIFGVRKYDDGIGYDWYSLDEAALYRRQNDDRD